MIFRFNLGNEVFFTKDYNIKNIDNIALLRIKSFWLKIKLKFCLFFIKMIFDDHAIFLLNNLINLEYLNKERNYNQSLKLTPGAYTTEQDIKDIQECYLKDMRYYQTIKSNYFKTKKE